MKKTAATVIIAVLALLAVLAAGALYFGRDQGTDGVFDTPSGALDERDLKKIPKETKQIGVLCCGVDYSQELTDVIMYVRYDPKENTAAVLSIPRDTFVGDEYPTGKINQIYKATGDMETLVEVVRERFRLPVDYYATITLDALADIVDEIGGIEVDIQKDLWDQGKLFFKAGKQTLNGEQAQYFVRLRHPYSNADLGRIEAQHQFMMSALGKVQSLGKLDLLQLVMNNFTRIKTDMPLPRIISVAASAFSIEGDAIEMFTVPGTGKMNYSYAVYEVDREALAEILSEHFLEEPVAADDLDFPQVAYQPPAPQQAPAQEEALPGGSPQEEPGGEPVPEAEAAPEEPAPAEDAPAQDEPVGED